METCYKEKVTQYIYNLKKTFEKIIKSNPEIKNKFKELIENVELYIKDAEKYIEENNWFTALCCIAYAEGLLDSLRFLKILDIEWEKEKIKMKKIVVAGTFEIIHPGHIYLFKEAAKYGVVYVIVARDKNVEKFKGRKPIIPESQRLEVVKSIRYVDYAILGDENDILRPIIEIKPDIIILGYDQKINEEWLKKELESRGLKHVKIIRLGKLEGELYSSSKIIKKIINEFKNVNL